MVFQENGNVYSLTITELENKTGTSKRTIRYYVKEGLLDRPHGDGGGARYGEKHILQLELIGLLQRNKQSLDSIRKELSRLDSIQKLVNEIQNEEERQLVVAQVRRRSKADLNKWLAGAPEKGISNLLGIVRDNESFLHLQRNDPYSLRDIQEGKPTRKEAQQRQQKEHVQVKPEPEKVKAEGTTWKRVEVADGLEINLRSDVEEQYSRIIVELAEKLREE